MNVLLAIRPEPARDVRPDHVPDREPGRGPEPAQDRPWLGDLADAADPGTLERLARGLRAEIAELTVVDSVRPADGVVVTPAGVKGADPVTLGAVVVALSASGGVLTALVETVRDWLSRQSAGHRVSVTIDGDTIELEHVTEAEQRDLVDAFIRRHTDV